MLASGAATFNLGADQLPPGIVTVTSSKGGSGTAPLIVTGAAFPADPVIAQAPATLTVQQGQQVQLDGSASLNATGFAWAQVAGTPTVTLSNANTSIASFTAPTTATTLTFRLTVQGPGGPKTTDEVVTVEAVAPPRANAGPAQSVLAGATVTLDGSASTGATSFLWKQTGGVDGDPVQHHRGQADLHDAEHHRPADLPADGHRPGWHGRRDGADQPDRGRAGHQPGSSSARQG